VALNGWTFQGLRGSSVGYFGENEFDSNHVISWGGSARKLRSFEYQNCRASKVEEHLNKR
jgi:hypothetical protein